MNYFTNEEYKLLSELINNRIDELDTDTKIKAESLISKLNLLAEKADKVASSQSSYESMDDIVSSMKDFVIKNGEIDLLCYDSPFSSELGWMDKESEHAWFISIANLRKYISTRTPDDQDLLNRAIASSEGKVNLALSLAGAANRVLHKSKV